MVRECHVRFSAGLIMPLHDWTDRMGWEGVHTLWLTGLLRWLKPRLPAGYRAYISSPPTLAIGAPMERPDVGVREWPADREPEPGSAAAGVSGDGGIPAPDMQVAVATLDPGMALQVERQGRLVAAVEPISPRNKDRPVARDTYLNRYLGYLLEGVHLLLVDVHRRPLSFSFGDRIAQELQIRQPPCPAPAALSYQVGEPPATGGRFLGIWRRPFTLGEPLPAMPLPLTVDQLILVDLERTYMQAAADAYLTGET
jgi:hypothetical protein